MFSNSICLLEGDSREREVLLKPQQVLLMVEFRARAGGVFPAVNLCMLWERPHVSDPPFGSAHTRWPSGWRGQQGPWILVSRPAESSAVCVQIWSAARLGRIPSGETNPLQFTGNQILLFLLFCMLVMLSLE